MTATSSIIYDAFRQSNLIALTALPTTAQQAEGLRYLNRILKSVFGNEVAEELYNIPIGKVGIQSPAGYPWYDVSSDPNWFVPKDARLMLNLDESKNFYLDPAPDDGTRFAVVNINSDLVNNPVTIYGNGRTIDGQTSLILNMDTANQEWFYRDDIGSWMMYTPLVIDPTQTPPIDMTFPFPEEFDDFFITMLAMRLNPTYGSQLDQQSNAVLMRVQKQLKARYTQHKFVAPERGVRALGLVSADRRQWNRWNRGDPTIAFNVGRTRDGYA